MQYFYYGNKPILALANLKKPCLKRQNEMLKLFCDDNVCSNTAFFCVASTGSGKSIPIVAAAVEAAQSNRCCVVVQFPTLLSRSFAETATEQLLAVRLRSVLRRQD